MPKKRPIKPSKAAIKADARLQIRTVSDVQKGECQDGIRWSFITIDGFAEFWCRGGRIDFIYPDQRDQIVAMLPFVESHQVKKLVMDIRGW